MSIAVAILGLAFLILVHEGGHFVTSLAVGMRPRRFYLGFGPAIVKTTRGGVEYGIGSIPLGGYVKIPGMHRPAASDVDVHLGRAVREAPELVGPVQRLKRRLDHGDVEGARRELPDVEAALAAASLSPEATRSANRGLQELSDATGADAYWRQRTWKRVAAILAGPAANTVLAMVLFGVIFMIGYGKATTVVGDVTGKPALAAGLRPGDRIVAIDHRPVGPADIPDRIQKSKGRPLTVTVVRAGRRLVLGPVRARKDEGAYRLGFRLRGRRLSAGEASWESVRLTGVVTKEVASSLANLVHKKDRKEIGSTVGIVQASSTAANEGVQSYLFVLGLISLSLALFNLLPLLPLDGGHIVFSIVEGLRGRSVRREIYERVSAAGIALVLVLFVIGLSNDIGRLGGG